MLRALRHERAEAAPRLRAGLPLGLIGRGLLLALALGGAGCRGPLAHTAAESPETCGEIDRYVSACGAACAAAGGSESECRTECADVRAAVETCYDYCLADARAPRACCERCVPTDPNHVPVPYPEPFPEPE